MRHRNGFRPASCQSRPVASRAERVAPRGRAATRVWARPFTVITQTCMTTSSAALLAVLGEPATSPVAASGMQRTAACAKEPATTFTTSQGTKLHANFLHLQGSRFELWYLSFVGFASLYVACYCYYYLWKSSHTSRVKLAWVLLCRLLCLIVSVEWKKGSVNDEIVCVSVWVGRRGWLQQKVQQ